MQKFLAIKMIILDLYDGIKENQNKGQFPPIYSSRFIRQSMDREFGLNVDIDAEFEPQWIWLILVLMPFSCIIGNTLVIAAVFTNKALQTPTNYLLVSLACADLMVGTCVMPFHIYMTINSLHWHLPTLTCYVYCVLDVLASTSSIIHLLLISMDRLVAATKPAEYKTYKHKRRVYFAIAFCWIFSICLSLPLVFGSNDETEMFLLQKHHCGIYNPTYMFGSSIFAFFLPLLFMSTIYGYIFYTLKRRLRAIQLQEMAGGQFLGFGADIGNIATSAIETVMGVGQKNRNMITWEKPLLKKIEETAAEHASSLNESEREQIQNILQAASSSGSGSATTNMHNNRQGYREEGTSMERNSILIEADEISQQPSMVLDAITMIHGGNSPPQMQHNRNMETNNENSGSTEFESRFLTVNNFLGVPQMPKRRYSEQVERKVSTNTMAKQPQIEVARTPRRHSYQAGQKKRISGGNSLKPQNKDAKKRMRRLSELITGWERPSRSSLSQMLQFARRDSVYMARKKLAGLKDWALDLIAKLKSKQGLAIRREARATKLVATVMGVFLICWAPYFSMNLYKIYKLYMDEWIHDTEYIFHWLSALGYLNSSLNFFIYSAINKKFRTTFWRLLGMKRSHKRKSWMLPPPKAPKTGRKGDRNVGTMDQMEHQNGQTISLVTSVDGTHAVPPTVFVKNSPKNKTGEHGKDGGKKQKKRGGGIASLIPLTRHLSIRKPQIVIEDVANTTDKRNSVSISAGGETTYRRSSDDCIQRSSSEVFGGGIIFPSGTHHGSRRGSGMSNSSASLQLHDIHQIEAQSAEEMAEVEVKAAEIFV